MIVKLRGKTVPIFDDIDDVCDASDLIGYCARVSNPENQKNFDTVNRLLKYCLRHAHWSVFEMADLIMEINTTRDISRQILRHRSFNFQEFSQRYMNVAALDNWVYREARLQDPKNRQNSIVNTDDQLDIDWFEFQHDVRTSAQKSYDWAIKQAIAKEQARAVLPEGMTPTKMFMKGNLRSWIFYCVVRTGPDTQKEHRLIAKECWEIVKKEFPFLKTFDLDFYRNAIMQVEI